MQDGLVENSTQEAAGRLLLESITINLDSDFDVSKDMISNLAKQKVDVPKKIKNATASKDLISNINLYFEDVVIPDINSILIDDIIHKMIGSLKNDISVPEGVRKKYEILSTENEPSYFLAQVFVYAINKQNKLIPQKQISGITPEQVRLLQEVKNRCPLCRDILLKETKKTPLSRFIIVKIMPSKTKVMSWGDFDIPEFLSKNENPSQKQIALCDGCAPIYNEDANYEDFLHLCKLKEHYMNQSFIQISLDEMGLEESIVNVINELLNIDCVENIQELSFDVLKLEQKILKTNPVLLDDIRRDVSKYFNFVELNFSKLRNFKVIAAEIKATSLKLEANDINQAEVVDQLSYWILDKVNLPNDAKHFRASQIIVAFFIQNCEVFSKQ